MTKTSGSESLGPQGHRNAKRTCRQQKEGHFKEGAECSRSDLDISRSLSNTGEFTTHLIEISGQFYGLMPQGKPAFSPSTWSPSQGLGRLNFFLSKPRTRAAHKQMPLQRAQRLRSASMTGHNRVRNPIGLPTRLENEPTFQRITSTFFAPHSHPPFRRNSSKGLSGLQFHFSHQA